MIWFRQVSFITGRVEQCSDSDSHCIKITAHNKNRTEKFEYFSCDGNLGNTTLCRDVNSSQVQCFNVSIYSFRGDRDRMVVGFTTTCVINAYHH